MAREITRPISEPVIGKVGDKWNVYDPRIGEYGNILDSFVFEQQAEAYVKKVMKALTRVEMKLEEYRNYIDFIGKGAPEWLAIIDWQHKQLELVEQGKRKPPLPTDKLVDVYFREVYSTLTTE